MAVVLNEGRPMEIDVFPQSLLGSEPPYLYVIKGQFVKELSKLEKSSFVLQIRGENLLFYPYTHPRPKQHLRYLLKKVLKPRDSSENELNIDWNKVKERLKREINIGTNTDVTNAFTADNIFLTKKYFTFGLRRVHPGECHIFQTYESPIIFYIPKETIYFSEKIIPYFESEKYDGYKLDQHSEYLVSENTMYMILTPLKSLFAVYRMKISHVIHHSRFKNPTENPLTVDASMSQNPLALLNDSFLAIKLK